MRYHLSAEHSTELVLEILAKLSTHPIRTASAFRSAMVENASLLAANPLLELSNTDITSMQLFEEAMTAVELVILQGRMIDFGYVPNAIIKAESLRARAAFEAGELAHPFANGWVGTMAWEGGFNAYYVQQATDEVGEAVFVFELYGVETSAGPAIMLYDGVRIEVAGPRDTRCHPAPLVRNAPPPDGKSRAQFDVERAANALDPLVTMLRFLADASIPVNPVPAPEKLNKARFKRGKRPIPPHTVVETRDYVTMLTHPHPANVHADRGGHHASPVAHFRRGHLRRIAADRVVQVRSSKVNWRSGEELHRIFYQVKGVSNVPAK